MIYLPLVNVVVFETDEGLVLVDAGTAAEGPAIAELVASVSSMPIHTIIYTHGHSDHAFGTWALVGDNPQIIATDALVARFDRYRKLRGSVARYLGQPLESMPETKDDMFYPTATFSGTTEIVVGGSPSSSEHTGVRPMISFTFGCPAEVLWPQLTTTKAFCLTQVTVNVCSDTQRSGLWRFGRWRRKNLRYSFQRTVNPLLIRP